MLQMRQRGAWWKGLTDDNIEVAISDDFFKLILAGQEQSVREHPALTLETRRHYGGLMVCQHPQWWVDCFLSTNYGIGPGEHHWIRKAKRGYSKLMMGRITQHGYNSNQVGSEGTLIFRQLSPKKAQEVREFNLLAESMQAYVENTFAEQFGIEVNWGGKN